MPKTNARSITQSPSLSKSKKPQGVGSAPSPAAVFVSMALDMSWRLVLAVPLPIIVGYELDKAFDTAPVLTIVSFAIAMLGMGLVLWQTLQKDNQQPVPKLTEQQKQAIKKQYEEDDD